MSQTPAPDQTPPTHQARQPIPTWVQVLVHGVVLLLIAWLAYHLLKGDNERWQAVVVTVAVLVSFVFQFLVFHRESGDPRPFHQYLRDPSGGRDARR